MTKWQNQTKPVNMKSSKSKNRVTCDLIYNTSDLSLPSQKTMDLILGL